MNKANLPCRDGAAFSLGILLALAFVFPLRSIPVEAYEPGSLCLAILFVMFSLLSWVFEKVLLSTSSVDPHVVLRDTLMMLWGMQVFDSIAIAFVPSVYLHSGRALVGLTALCQMAYLTFGISAYWIYPCKNLAENYITTDALSLTIGAFISTIGTYVVAALPDSCLVRGSKALVMTFAALTVEAFIVVKVLRSLLAPGPNKRGTFRRSIHMTLFGALLHQSVYFMFPSATRVWGREGTALAVAGAGKIWTIANIGIASFAVIPDLDKKQKRRVD